MRPVTRHRQAVNLELEPAKVVLLDLLCELLNKSRDETVSAALNALFIRNYRAD